MTVGNGVDDTEAPLVVDVCGRMAVVSALKGVLGDVVENVCDRTGVDTRVVAGSVGFGDSVTSGDD